MAVGDRDGRRPFDRVNQSVVTIRHRDVVYPNVRGSEQGNGIAIASRAVAVVVNRVSDQPSRADFDVMDADVVDDDVVGVLYGDAGALRDVDLGPTPVYRLVAHHDQLLSQADHHATCECDPQRLLLNHGVSESSLFRVHEVIVGRVVHHVILPGLASGRVATEP